VRNLASLFEPASVAVLGASDTAGKWGNLLAQTVVGGEHRRQVFLVNRRGGEVLGRRAYRSLSELPCPPELVLIAVPEQAFESAVDDALAAGAQAIVGIVAGLGEASDANRERERAVAERVRDAGAVLLGPNCMGVIDTSSELSAAAHLTLEPGAIAVVTQSGGLGIELALRAASVGVGFSRFVSLGNQADLVAADFVGDLATHDATKVIVLYLEDLRDGRELARAARLAGEHGKGVVALIPGRSEATARAASSHTGSLIGDERAVDALCDAGGIVRTSSPRELFEVAFALLAQRPVLGRRLAVVSDGGGAAVVGATLSERAGFTVPPFSAELSAAIAAASHELATVANPLDLLADDPGAMAHAVEKIAGAGEVDAALVTGALGYIASRRYPRELGDLHALEVAEVQAAEAIGRTAQATGFPVVVATLTSPSPVVTELARWGVPAYDDAATAVRVLRLLAERSIPTGEIPGLPAAAAPIEVADYEAARVLLSAHGIPFAELRFVRDTGEALAAASEIGYPVVLKALGSLHKSDSGGVALGLADERELTRAFADMESRLHPPRYSVERMAPLDAGVELIVGARWDERLGPIVLVGLGGVFTEVLRDVRTLLAPCDREAALGALESLSGAELLRGTRGRRPVKLGAVADIVVALSHAAAEHPEIAELEINPVLALPDGAIALDARIVLAPQSGSVRVPESVR
jgi:acyl-CoA synthetase (NDP forming)